jgi:hypothetical protein
MPDSETFDAFYARTVGRITSQMHELAGNDGLADHAIREAYAKAYQQWYEVSDYRDSEEWVLSTAQEAYERRRTEAGFDRYAAAAAQAADSGTWPGIYRPRATAGDGPAGQEDQPALDPDATMARPARLGRPQRSVGRRAGKLPTDAPAADTPDYPAASAPPAGYPTRGHHASGSAVAGARARRGGLSQPVSRRTLLIAGSAIAALVIASIAYLASGGHTNTPAASKGNTTPVVGKPKVQMLRAGKTGKLKAVPWSLVAAGWALAETSTAQPGSAGQASGAGTYTTYLVDPEGGKYRITTSSGSAEPQLMAWSGDDKTALFDTVGAAGGTASYQLLDVRTGQLTPLQLPPSVVAIGFTRPDGQAILAVNQGPAKFRLQRYTLAGLLQGSLATLPRKAGETLASNGCTSACALSSPDGITDVWGITGDGMEMLSNQGGKATRPHVQGSGHPSLCMPVTWWNDTTVLASCPDTSLPDDASRLWLMPDNSAQPTALTAATAAGDGRINGAWLAGQTTYVSMVTSHQCPSAPSGPGGLDILPLGQGPSAAISIPRSTHNVSTIVATEGKRLLVLAQTSCPGTSSLLWFNPSTHRSLPVILAPAGQVGVIAAVPFGNGPTAVTDGDY